MRNGYKMIYMPEHHRADSTGCVYEHIIVAEKILGRELKPEEVVHHIDKNRSNNIPDNLMVFATNAEHTAYHKNQEAYQIENIWFAKRKLRVCENCGKQFSLTNYDQRYCSPKCAHEAKRLINLDINLIVNELKELNGNISALARKYNVSDCCITKTLKRNNLPYHSKDYKKMAP